MLVIDQDRIDAVLTWPALVDALDAGHRLGRGQTHDVLLEEGGDILLSRTAWKAGYGIGIKTVTGFFGNPGRTPPLPSVQGVFVLFDHDDGRPLAVIDGAGITAWKTAADSALGSRYLSRPDARCLLMVGAGALARPLIRAHLSVRPAIEKVLVWNRTPARAEALAAELRARRSRGRGRHRPRRRGRSGRHRQQRHPDRAAADRRAHGSSPGPISTSWARSRPRMREADDAALRRGRLFVDARETTLEHIGELKIPIAQGVIGRDDVVADLYDLAAGFAWQRSAGDITIYKNGGGAHLDLMTAIAIYRGARRAILAGDGQVLGQHHEAGTCGDGQAEAEDRACNALDRRALRRRQHGHRAAAPGHFVRRVQEPGVDRHAAAAGRQAFGAADRLAHALGGNGRHALPDGPSHRWREPSKADASHSPARWLSGRLRCRSSLA